MRKSCGSSIVRVGTYIDDVIVAHVAAMLNLPFSPDIDDEPQPQTPDCLLH